MKRSAKADSADVLQSGTSPGPPAKQRVAKRSRKQSRTRSKRATSGNKIERSVAKTPRLGSGIREAEEARALLEDQLGSLYWWVFNAFKMKGYIRAKALDELQRRSATGDETHFEQGDLADDHVSPKPQTF
jgi:hypothetical protein